MLWFYSLSLHAAAKFVLALQNSAVKESAEMLQGYMFCGALWMGRELLSSRIQKLAAQVSGVPISSLKSLKWFSQRHSLQAALMTRSETWQDCRNGEPGISARKGAREKDPNYAGRSKGLERTTRDCNSKDLSTVNASHGRFALCR